jgi:hypothetical protein
MNTDGCREKTKFAGALTRSRKRCPIRNIKLRNEPKLKNDDMPANKGVPQRWSTGEVEKRTQIGRLPTRPARSGVMRVRVSQSGTR